MHTVNIPCISVDDAHHSRFIETQLSTSDHNGMWITTRQNALNFRHRVSAPGYASTWHVAGDPTLIIIRQGELVIELRDGSRKVFRAGDQFIAADYLPSSIPFSEQHGHRAFVQSDEALEAIHIKLSDDPVAFRMSLMAT